MILLLSPAFADPGADAPLVTDQKADAKASPITEPIHREDNEVTAKGLNPSVALMEMLNKRQPKVEAMAFEQKDDGAVLDPRVALATMLSIRAPPSVGPNCGSVPPRLDTDEECPAHQSTSTAPPMPLSPVPISNANLSQPGSPLSYEKQLNPESPVINGFFPATTRHIRKHSKLDDEKHSERGARYENKTSSNARGGRVAESTSSPPSPLAQETNIYLPEIPSSSNSPEPPELKRISNPSAAVQTNYEASGKGLYDNSFCLFMIDFS
jgi:hypothetical protein